MRPVFWHRFNLANIIRRTARENIYRKSNHHSHPRLSVSAANAQVYQRDLVQKTGTQLFEYNHEEARCTYTRPTVDLQFCQKYWGYLTKGMSPAELSDFEEARSTLENYEKIYSISEYCSMLHEGITCLEKRIMTNNPTMP